MKFIFKRFLLMLFLAGLGYYVYASDSKATSDSDLLISAKTAMQNNNYDAAFSLLNSMSNNPEAQYLLGQMYFIGSGNVPLDQQKAVDLYMKSASSGYAKAELMLGDLYEAGNVLSQDWNKAMQWYMSAASHGSNEACYALAKNYYNGMGVKQDYLRSIYWYAKAAQLGNIDGMQMLGQIYIHGIGVEANTKIAISWYTKAAEAGSLDSQVLLGETYASGILVGQDYSQSLKWYTIAAVGGDAAAQGMIIPIIQKMRPYNSQNITQIIDSLNKVKKVVQDPELITSLNTELETYKAMQANYKNGN